MTVSMIDEPICGIEVVLVDRINPEEAIAKDLVCELPPDHDGWHEDGSWSWTDRMGTSR